MDTGPIQIQDHVCPEAQHVPLSPLIGARLFDSTLNHHDMHTDALSIFMTDPYAVHTVLLLWFLYHLTDSGYRSMY